MIDVGPMYISRAIVSALVAIAESTDDPFRAIALEALCCLGTTPRLPWALGVTQPLIEFGLWQLLRTLGWWR